MHYVFNPDHYIGIVIANTTLLYKYTSAAQFTVGTIFLIVRCEKMVHQIYRIYPVVLLFSFFMSDWGNKIEIFSTKTDIMLYSLLLFRHDLYGNVRNSLDKIYTIAGSDVSYITNCHMSNMYYSQGTFQYCFYRILGNLPNMDNRMSTWIHLNTGKLKRLNS